jgi:sporulation protein YhbH
MDAHVSLSHQDWSLHRRARIDEARHRERLKEAIRDNLNDIVSDGAIISSDGQKIVKVPLRGLELPRFRHSDGSQQHTGQGDGDTQVGDVLGPGPGRQGTRAPGRGKQAGDQPGVDYFEAEITVDELAELLFESLNLPRIQPKRQPQQEAEELQFTDVQRMGILPNLDKRRTILENLRRNAKQGKPVFAGVRKEDLRFKTWREVHKPNHRAVVVAMRDVSGSMGEFEQWVSRCCYFWMVRFLRTRYERVEIVFITHHTEAKEVDEQAFFHLGESGGTLVSSAYKLALDVLKQRFPTDEWNAYVFHFSDGDNWGDGDNQQCVALIKELLPLTNLVGYGEIRERGRYSQGTLLEALGQIHDPGFATSILTDRSDLTKALQRFFGTEAAA